MKKQFLPILASVILLSCGSGDLEELYKVDSTDESGRQTTLRIVLNDRFEKDTLIEIARELKEKSGSNNKFVCFYNIGVNSQSGAYASAAYLPNCNDCANEKDKNGTDITYRLFGPTREQANKIQNRKYSNSNGNQFIGAYIHEQSVAKCEFYKTPQNKYLQVTLFADNSEDIKYLEERIINGQTRYYYTNENDWFDPEFDGEVYLTIDLNTKITSFNGKTYSSYFKLI